MHGTRDWPQPRPLPTTARTCPLARLDREVLAQGRPLVAVLLEYPQRGLSGLLGIVAPQPSPASHAHHAHGITCAAVRPAGTSGE